jgi:hypothetical protein
MFIRRPGLMDLTLIPRTPPCGRCGSAGVDVASAKRGGRERPVGERAGAGRRRRQETQHWRGFLPLSNIDGSVSQEPATVARTALPRAQCWRARWRCRCHVHVTGRPPCGRPRRGRGCVFFVLAPGPPRGARPRRGRPVRSRAPPPASVRHRLTVDGDDGILDGPSRAPLPARVMGSPEAATVSRTELRVASKIPIPKLSMN